MSNIKVGIDISQINYPGGVARYTDTLANSLSREARNLNLKLSFFYSSLRNSYRGALPNVKSYPMPNTFMEFLFNRFRVIPIETFLGPIDIFHSSDWTQPPTKAKKVTTCHDVIPLKYPQWSHPKIVDVHQRRLKIVEKEIDMVIAVSEATKKDLIEISSIPAEKITVIYEGVADNFYPRSEKEIAELKKKYNLPDKFVLSLGGVGERKNLDRIKKASNDYNLVIPGQTIPHISDQEMSILYSAASVLFYPSLYEGFGLPVLEAFSCGTPVLTSNNSSLPEVGKDAAIYVDPLNVEEMKKSLKSIMNDNDLRKELKSRGIKQSKNFSWEKCAYETAQVYKKLLQK